MQLTEKEFWNLEDASELVCEYCGEGLNPTFEDCQNCVVLKLLDVVEVIPVCEKCGSNMEFKEDFSGEFEYNGKSRYFDNVEAWVCPNCQSIECSVLEVREIVRELTEE